MNSLGSIAKGAAITLLGAAWLIQVPASMAAPPGYEHLTERFTQLQVMSKDLMGRFQSLAEKDVASAQREVDDLTVTISEFIVDAKEGSRLHAAIDSGIHWAEKQIERIESDDSISADVRETRTNRYKSEVSQLEEQKFSLVAIHERLDLAFSKLTIHRSALAEEALIGDLESTRQALGKFVEELQAAVADLENLVEGKPDASATGS